MIFVLSPALLNLNGRLSIWAYYFALSALAFTRNLGVHVSKVRSLTLDVKVWEPTILDLFRALGNAYCNSIWEGLLQMTNERAAASNVKVPSITKPCPRDAIHEKEKYIQAKYVEKLLVTKEPNTSDASPASSIWQAVKEENLREVYCLIVISDENVVNSTFNEAIHTNLHLDAENQNDPKLNSSEVERTTFDPTNCQRITSSKNPEDCLDGCSLLHLACDIGNAAMVELLLQFGAYVNHRDFHGRMSLHHCISKGNYTMTKFLLRRGASASVRDGGGLSVLERAMEMGAITDEELFLLLTERQ